MLRGAGYVKGASCAVGYRLCNTVQAALGCMLSWIVKEYHFHNGVIRWKQSISIKAMSTILVLAFAVLVLSPCEIFDLEKVYQGQRVQVSLLKNRICINLKHFT